SFLRACRTFFDQGQTFFTGWSTIENGVIGDSIDSLKTKSKHVERKMQDRHMLVPREVFQHPTGMSPDPDVVMEGYLFKRATNAFKTWNRRWFQIRDSKLLYCHRTSEDVLPTVMESDLKLCLVRPAPPTIERACCFELVTPTKSHLLQADSESLCNAWMRALQRTIHHLHESEDNDNTDKKSTFTSDREHAKSIAGNGNGDVASSVTSSSSPGRSRRSMLEELRVVAGNDLCADCGAPNPKWASINLGVTLCIECCGIHRSLGVQISKVRSLTMDSFDSEHRRLMLLLGNTRVNGAYLAYLPESDVVPPPAKPNCSRAVREAWIKAKYVERRFSRPSKERTRDAAQARNDHLCLSKHKNSIGSNLNPLSPTRSASMLNLSGEGEKPPESPAPAAATAETPTLSGSLVVWRSSPSLHRRHPSPNSHTLPGSDDP
uniref:Uncharacterized protein n=1 Tax=Plectus sambesii TaxID=2011161 RepID=A0A914UK71_9BILA